MKSVTQYRSEAGNLFDTEHEAHRDDLRHWLFTAAGNDAIARKIATAAESDLDAFAAIVTGMKRTAPVAEPQLALGSPAINQGYAQIRCTEPFERAEMRRVTPDGW